MSDHVHLVTDRHGNVHLDAVGAVSIEPHAPSGGHCLTIYTDEGEQVQMVVVGLVVHSHSQQPTTQDLYTTDEPVLSLVALPGGRHD